MKYSAAANRTLSGGQPAGAAVGALAVAGGGSGRSRAAEESGSGGFLAPRANRPAAPSATTTNSAPAIAAAIAMRAPALDFAWPASGGGATEPGAGGRALSKVAPVAPYSAPSS